MTCENTTHPSDARQPVDVVIVSHNTVNDAVDASIFKINLMALEYKIEVWIKKIRVFATGFLYR